MFFRRSAPEQKWPPAPVSTTHRTPASACADSKAERTPSMTPRVIALRASGRSIVTMVVLPIRSTFTSLMRENLALMYGLARSPVVLRQRAGQTAAAGRPARPAPCVLGVRCRRQALGVHRVLDHT